MQQDGVLQHTSNRTLHFDEIRLAAQQLCRPLQYEHGLHLGEPPFLEEVVAQEGRIWADQAVLAGDIELVVRRRRRARRRDLRQSDRGRVG